MFNIYGGGTKFTQWAQNQKLIMKELPVGADVQFFQDPNEDDPLITEVYELVEESGSTIKVCDVPNVLLTSPKKIKVYVDSKVYGAFGVAFNVIGNREKYYEVEAAAKPSDYVYEETPLKGCGCDCDSDGITDEQIKAAVDKYLSENGVDGSVSDDDIATDEEVEDALNDIFGM